MRQFLVCLMVELFIFTACGSNDDVVQVEAGWVGSPCQSELDCSVDVCLHELVNETVSPPVIVDFVNGMCTEDCEISGEWYYDYEMCLTHMATDAKYLFNSCRNSLDCRQEDDYICVFVGLDINWHHTNVCVPESAIQKTANGRHTSDIYTTGIWLK